MKSLKRKISSVPVILASLALSGCNFLGWIDSPSGDDARLSVARGCFDAGDYECARANYEALTDDSADLRQAELVYLTLEEEGAGFGAFLKTIVGSTGSPGALVRDLANEMAALDAGEAKRNRLVAALIEADSISSQGLRGFARFLVSTSLFAELLAEVAGDNGALDASDVAAGGSSCQNSTCAIESACDKPADGGLETAQGTQSAAIVDEGSLDGSPSIRMINGVIAELNTALVEMGASGSYSQGSTEIADQLSAIDSGLAEAAYSSCMVQTMFSLGIIE